MRVQKIPGLSLAVLRNGKIEFVKSYGFSNLEHHVPVKPETIFQSGSIGKQFTATAIMILVEEGKLSLDDKISKYLNDLPETWNSISVRHLLTHTSGLGEYPTDLDLRRISLKINILRSSSRFRLRTNPALNGITAIWDTSRWVF